MYSPSRNRTPLVFFFLLMGLALLVLNPFGILQPFQDIALALLQPFIGGAQSARTGAADLAGNLQDPAVLRARIVELQNQVDAYKSQTARMTELEKENLLLRQQLGFKQAAPDYDLTGGTVLQRNPDLAHVTALDPSNLIYTLIVDQGSAQGVKPGMPIVTPQGLAGRVTAVGAQWAKVLLMIDPSSSVNAVVQSTRATGVVQGTVNGQLVIKYVPQGEAIREGDLILTSGIGGNFPKRLLIGQVTQVRKRDIELFQEADIQPSVDFSRLEFVLILKKFTPSDITQEPTPTATAIPRPTRTPTPSQ
ncbi:MAG: rod shape-determining protein MreC [Chloroflexi bacterium]|nr:rod shape-determining protein MreC [Chloroflexota bacterium]